MIEVAYLINSRLVDNGNLFRLTGNQVPPTPYFQGRFSNGPVWSEILGSEFQIVPASTINYAVGGSTSGNVNSLSAALDAQLPSLPFQVNSQFNQFLTQGSVSPNALFVVSAGANDYLFLPTQLRVTNTQTVVNNISNTVTTLIDKGVRNTGV